MPGDHMAYAYCRGDVHIYALANGGYFCKTCNYHADDILEIINHTKDNHPEQNAAIRRMREEYMEYLDLNFQYETI